MPLLLFITTNPKQFTLFLPFSFSSNSKVVRKSVARVLTVINQKKRAAVRVAFSKYRGRPGKPFSHPRLVPIDLREKKTRAIRRALSTADKNRKTVKQQKKLTHFPRRKFAVKA